MEQKEDQNSPISRKVDERKDWHTDRETDSYKRDNSQNVDVWTCPIFVFFLNCKQTQCFDKCLSIHLLRLPLKHWDCQPQSAVSRNKWCYCRACWSTKGLLGRPVISLVPGFWSFALLKKSKDNKAALIIQTWNLHCTSTVVSFLLLTEHVSWDRIVIALQFGDLVWQFKTSYLYVLFYNHMLFIMV
jgi:hypothetical protein